MNPLTLHYHPLSSYCHKVLIALDELAITTERRIYNPGDPTERSAYLKLWPLGKMPLLIDQEKPVPETSTIIEHLQLHHAGPGRRLIPQDAEQALEVRLWDRLMDLYVMTPMQAFTADLLRPEAERDAPSVVRAREALQTAYALIDGHLGGRTWMAGTSFSMADCAAAPALFYARAYVSFGPEHGHLRAYFERLVARPSVAHTIDGARPFFKYFPGRAGLERRFYVPESD